MIFIQNSNESPMKGNCSLNRKTLYDSQQLFCTASPSESLHLCGLHTIGEHERTSESCQSGWGHWLDKEHLRLERPFKRNMFGIYSWLHSLSRGVGLPEAQSSWFLLNRSLLQGCWVVFNSISVQPEVARSATPVLGSKGSCWCINVLGGA